MKRYYPILLTTILTTFLGCSDDRKFPEVRNLTFYKETEILPTLEHAISKDKNALYSSSLLFAWDDIRKRIEQPINIDNSFTDLILLNNSKSFMKSLDSNEYYGTGKIEDGVVKVRAEFSKSLPFELKLTSFTNQLTFDGKKVESFGKVGYDNHSEGIIQILYYKDDNNFILKLLPRDKEHEIILFKSSDTYKSMGEILPLIANKIMVGKKEKITVKKGWRYNLTDEDEVVIPKFKFNIENNYVSIEGKNFKGGNQNYLIETAYQRTAFILDESGAEIESEAEVELMLDDVEEEETKPHPKKMRFDKPFFLMLKRVDCDNPYFGLWTNNSELMVIEK